jgi:SNW domain-containing protein 1
VLHSPPRKLTPQDHDDWKIPPCISQWKNTKVPHAYLDNPKPLTITQGYTIPLHMRLAADGRGAQTVEINDKFAHFNESLSIAQEAAREAITARAREREAAARREKEVHEERLRMKAQEARLGRAGFNVDEAPVQAAAAAVASRGNESYSAGGGGGGRRGGDVEEESPEKEPTPEKETREEREERRKRDDLRCRPSSVFIAGFAH